MHPVRDHSNFSTHRFTLLLFGQLKVVDAKFKESEFVKLRGQCGFKKDQKSTRGREKTFNFLSISNKLVSPSLKQRKLATEKLIDRMTVI